MLLVFMNGREIARHPGIASDHLEYVFRNFVLTGREIKEGFTQVDCSRIRCWLIACLSRRGVAAAFYRRKGIVIVFLNRWKEVTAHNSVHERR